MGEVIDFPMDVLTQAEVEAEGQRLSALVERVPTELKKRAVTAAKADATYKVEYAKAFLRAEGSVAVRDALAVGECADHYMNKKTTEALLMAAQEAGRSYRASLDWTRAVNANLRALVT